jgi:hypothetical protein
LLFFLHACNLLLSHKKMQVSQTKTSDDLSDTQFFRLSNPLARLRLWRRISRVNLDALDISSSPYLGYSIQEFTSARLQTGNNRSSTRLRSGNNLGEIGNPQIRRINSTTNLDGGSLVWICSDDQSFDEVFS